MEPTIYYFNNNDADSEGIEIHPDIIEEDEISFTKEEIEEEKKVLEDANLEEEKNNDDGKRLSSSYVECQQEAKKKRCLKCSTKFKTERAAIKHIKAKHFEDGDSNYRYNCLKCRVVYNSSVKLSAHNTRMHNEAEVFKCVKCDIKVISKLEALEHLSRNPDCDKASIKRVPTVSSKTVVLDCLVCGKTFKNMGGLSNHMKVCFEIPVLEVYSEESDEDVLFSVDCNTHKEIPLKRRHGFSK